MTQVYNAAVIGAGFGGHLSIKALEASERYHLVAVADVSESAREQVKTRYPTIQTFSNHHEVFEFCQLDVVCISTWATSHLEITDYAIKQSLSGILVEKPLADNYQDASNLLNKIRTKSLPMAVPHGLLVSPHVLEILNLVQSGAIGKIRLIEIQCSGWDIINAGIHWLNFAVVLLKQEPINWVMSTCDTSTMTYRDGIQVETIAVTYVQTQSGARIVMNTGDYVKTNELDKDTVLRIVGTAGSIEFYAWEPVYRIINPNYPQGNLVKVNPGIRTRHQIHLENLANQMDNRQTDYSIAESSLAALEICEAAFISSQHQCAVSLPLSDFVIPPKTNWQLGSPYKGHGGGRNGRDLPPLRQDQRF